MSAAKSTTLAFWLNIIFSVIETVFGVLLGSSAVLADSVHDFGDACAIGISAYLERFSNRQADDHYSLGYKRFSLLGAMVTATILITGSAFVLLENAPKLFNPQPVDYNGMLVLGLVAIAINLLASRVVSQGHTKNEGILSLHFLEDILGWLAVIVVALVLQFTDWYILDPLLSLIISAFILSKAIPRFWSNLKIFLASVPEGINLAELRQSMESLDAVAKVCQINVWTMDGLDHCAIVHVVPAPGYDSSTCKRSLRQALAAYRISQLTIEIDQTLSDHQAHSA